MSKEISPSTLPKLAECALFEGASGTSAAAERGTAVDIAIRNMISAEHDVAIVGEDAGAITYGVEELKRLAKGSFVETREEYLAMAVPGLSKLGTADAVCKAEKWVADIKTGQVRDYRNQLQAYSLACMEDNFEMSWTAHVIYVDQAMIRSYDFTYEEAKQGMQRVIDRATSAEAKPTLCEYCSWCKHYNNCHAIVRQAERVLSRLSPKRPVTASRPSKIASLPRRSHLAHLSANGSWRKRRSPSRYSVTLKPVSKAGTRWPDGSSQA